MNVACIQRSPISSLPKVLGNRNVMSNPWFATTWQGAHVGGQNNRIFSQRIYKFPEEKNARRDITWKPAMVLCIRPFSSCNIGSRPGKQERSARRLSLLTTLLSACETKAKKKVMAMLTLILYCFLCRHENLFSLCTDPLSAQVFFFLGEGGGGLYTG